MGLFFAHQTERQEGLTEEAKVGAAQVVRAFAGPLAAGRQWNEDGWGMGRIMILPLTNRSPITARNVSIEQNRYK